jgi:hypothetical protein
VIVTGDLFGPDLIDLPREAVEEVGDPIQVWSAQFVNRWVFLSHQRPSALRELKELISEALRLKECDREEAEPGTAG